MRIKNSLVVLAAIAVALTACSGKTDGGKTKTVAAKGSENVTNNKPQKKGDKKMKTVEMTKEMFKDKVLDYQTAQEWNYKGERPAVIDFYATWCGPCKATAPNVEKIAEEYDGKVDVYKVDVDQQEELAAIFGIQSIPTILFIPKTGNPVKNVGAMSYEQLKQAVNQVLL